MTNDEIEIVPLDVTDLTPRLGLCWGHLDAWEHLDIVKRSGRWLKRVDIFAALDRLNPEPHEVGSA